MATNLDCDCFFGQFPCPLNGIGMRQWITVTDKFDAMVNQPLLEIGIVIQTVINLPHI